MHYERWRKHGDVTVDLTRRCDAARFRPCGFCGRPGVRPDQPFCSQRCHVRWRHANSSSDKTNSEATKRDQAAKLAVIQAIKLEHGCADCGYNEHAIALDFDHRPGEIKELSIGADRARVGLSRLLAEIEKCDVVCANCHRVRTQDRLAAEIAALPPT